jgi:hypothetical protein
MIHNVGCPVCGGSFRYETGSEWTNDQLLLMGEHLLKQHLWEYHGAELTGLIFNGVEYDPKKRPSN